METIADDSFDGCTDLTLTAPEDSYAYDWAVEKGYIEEVQESPVEDFEYTIENDEVTITGYIGSDTVVVIPSRIDNCPVTSIDDSTFNGSSSLTSVNIPDGITSIGVYAFIIVAVWRILTSQIALLPSNTVPSFAVAA